MSRAVFALAAPALAVAAAAVAAGCSAAPDADDAGGAGCFIAFNPAFDGFRQWTSYRYDSPADGEDASVHVSGPRTEYVNATPAHGSTAFEVGTVIVKEVGADDPTNHHLFAMVKRGCDFNDTGAVGWEWMELDEATGGATIRWRGFGPPAGENYGGDPNGCNGCHVACSSNDDVCSPHIVLATY